MLLLDEMSSSTKGMSTVYFAPHRRPVMNVLECVYTLNPPGGLSTNHT